MSEKISQKFRSYLASTLIQSLKNLTPPSWKSGSYYAVGSQVASNGRLYIAVTTGNTASIAPTHTNGVVLDGTVQWLYVSSAINVSDIASNLYLGIGHPSEWNEADTPEVARTTAEKETKALDELITLIRLNSTNIRMGLKKEDWISGTIFSKFDPEIEPSAYGNTIPALYTTVSSEAGVAVYKCIDNNNGAPSTDTPSGQQLGYVLMSDGYIWKFMGSVETIDQVKFSTEYFYPISTKYTNDGSDQWQVQEQARFGSVSSFGPFITTGSFSSIPTASVVGVGTEATAGVEFNNPETGVYDLTRIWCATSGQNYNAETYAIVKNTLNSPGDGAAVNLIISNGVVSLDSIVGGTGYTNGAVLVIVGDGVGAEGEVTTSSGVVSVVDITDGGHGYTWAKGFIIPGDAGAVGKALMAPSSGHGKDIIAELGARTAVFSIQIDESLSPYIVNGEYRQITLISSAQPKDGIKQNSAYFIGPKHHDYNSGSATEDKYLKGSGHLLYLNNIEAVNHSSEQEEAIKIALTF